MATPFRGWSDEALDFYRRLEAENNRTFWTANRATYEAEVKAPFEALSDLVADEFGPLKVFRPNRDVRFSKDKSPYKNGATRWVRESVARATTSRSRPPAS